MPTNGLKTLNCFQSNPISSATLNSTSCFADFDGSIDITVSGGASPYSYEWSNGDTIEDPDSLCAGNYNVQVIDNDSCSNNYTLDIFEPDSLTVLLNGSNPNCDMDNGIISAIPSGGTSPYYGVLTSSLGSVVAGFNVLVSITNSSVS